MAEERDVVIVGGGIAGLVCGAPPARPRPAWCSRRPTASAAASGRSSAAISRSASARTCSRRPTRWSARSSRELGLEVMPITGSMLNIHLGGRMVRDVRPELLPFRLPLSLAGRVSFARAGLKVKRDADAYMKLLARGPGETDADVRLRALKHRGDETFLDFLGKLHPDAFRIFEALSNRSLADPDEISQSAMSALFGHVWDTGDLGRNMRGGSGLLPDALGASLGPIVRLGYHRDLDEPRRRGRAHRATRARTVPARSARARRSPPSRRRTCPGVLGDAIDARDPRGARRRHVRADGRAQHPHRRDVADAVGRPLLGAHARPALQHVLQPRQLHARRRAEAGQRDHGLRRRPARARVARRLRGRRARHVPRRPRPDVPAGAPAHRRDLGQGLGPRRAVRRARALARAGGARPRHRRPHLPGRRLGLGVRLDGDRRADGGRCCGERAPRARAEPRSHDDRARARRVRQPHAALRDPLRGRDGDDRARLAAADQRGRRALRPSRRPAAVPRGRPVGGRRGRRAARSRLRARADRARARELRAARPQPARAASRSAATTWSSRTSPGRRSCYEDGVRRDAAMGDFERFIKLAHVYDEIDSQGGLPCEPSDLPFDSRHLDMQVAAITLSDKPHMGALFDGLEGARRPRAGGDRVRRPRGARARARDLRHRERELAAAATTRRWSTCCSPTPRRTRRSSSRRSC